ncbi:MAG: oligosaccharide flippase family protein [Candidatus Scalindua sp.]|jgi:O-antigen/teichoic acid export membrane protein|nr:oligosaccharide flippase family protein [Candidatus Scalindua sp.]
MSRFSQYTKNIGALLGQSFVQRILGMVTTIVLARILGSASFGVYSIVVNTASSAYGFVRLGVDSAIHVHMAEGHTDNTSRHRSEEILSAGLLLLLLAGVLGGLGCFLMADWLAENIYGQQELAVWIRAAGIVVFLQCVFQFCYTAMAGLHQFIDYARIMVVSAIFNVFAITGGAFYAGLSGAVVAMIGAQIFMVVWLSWGLKNVLHIESLQLTLRNFIAQSRLLLKFGFPFYAAGLVSIPVAYYLQGLVVQHAGLESLGYLRIIMALVVIVTFIPASAAAPMISMLTRTRMEDESTLADKIMRNVKLVFIIALVMATVVILVLPWLIPFLFGHEYVEATGAAALAMITAILMAVIGVIGNALFSAKRIDLIFFSTLIQAGVFFIAGVLLIPIYGLLGYLVAELIGLLVILVVVYYHSLSWLRMNAVQFSWLRKMLIPLALLTAYSINQVSYNGIPSINNSLVGFAGLIFICIWGYKVVLDNVERNVIRRWLGVNN